MAPLGEKGQTMTTPWAFMTQQDWVEWDVADLNGQLRVVASRLSKLGIAQLSEQSINWIVAMVIAHMIETSRGFPSYESIFSVVNQCKREFDMGKRPYPCQRLSVYPESPNDLPTNVFEHCYTEDDTPFERIIPRV